MIPKKSIGLAMTLLVTSVGLVNIQENAIAQQRLTNKKSLCLPESGCLDDPKSPLSLIVLAPPRGAIRERRPTFSWHSLEGANGYTVSIERAGRLLWQVSNIAGTELAYPEEEDSLELGKNYDLIIEANDPGETTGKVRFRTLSGEELQTLERQIQLIRERASSADENTLALAQFYQTNDLNGEAIALLQDAIAKGTTSVPIYLSLGQLYLEQVQAPGLAEPVYQKALALARAQAVQAPILQAEAQIGLAKVAFALDNEDRERGILSLRGAYDNYVIVGDREFEAAQVAQFLGEMYHRQEELSYAIQWYRVALEHYKNLEDREYVSAIEEILEDLERQA